MKFTLKEEKIAFSLTDTYIYGIMYIMKVGRSPALRMWKEKKTMVECKNCPYFYKGEDDDF